MTKLSIDTLSSLRSDVATPDYNHGDVSPGIVHIGVGNFHRAHQAVYLDDLFNRGQDRDWAIIGGGVRPGDATMRDRLAPQDWLTTVVELEPGAWRARVIGSMVDFLPVENGNGPLIRAMAAPETRIVSLTVTEGGYFIDAMTGKFDPTHPDLVHHGGTAGASSTVFGAIAAALKARRAAGLEPFTVMSCDNLPGNGHIAQEAVVGVAALSDPALGAWIDGNVAFPNGMVDRVTPATGPRERELVAARFGIEDTAPVVCEPFRQWVLENNFPAGRPAFEEVGVTLTDRVDAFETMKIRILNGGHAIIAYPGGLLDIEYVHEAMAHPLIAAFLRRVLTEEVVPIVPPVPETNLDGYVRLVTDRFANPEVGDTIRRLCLDGSNRQPKFVIPSIRDNLRRGSAATGLILLSALWCRYCEGHSESGAEIAPNDPNWADLVASARKARHRPDAWLDMEDVYGDLAQNQELKAAFSRYLELIWTNGTARVLEAYLEGTLNR